MPDRSPSRWARLDINGEIARAMPNLPDKFIVDFANSIPIINDHVRVQRKRTGFFNRCMDAFTGNGARRQAEVNASVSMALEGAFELLQDMTNSLAETNFAVVKVNERVNDLCQHVQAVAGYAKETRDQLEQLRQSVNERFSRMEARIAHLDWKYEAHKQLEVVMCKWLEGNYRAFPAAQRCYLALEELRWGTFGDFCRNHDSSERNDLLTMLRGRLKERLQHELKFDSLHERRPAALWTEAPSACAPVSGMEEAVAYFGDWWSPNEHPLAYTLSQLPEKLPSGFPRLFSVEQFTDRFMGEIFGGAGWTA